MIDAGLVRLYGRFVAAGFPCFVGGSVAGMVYAEPRATLDIDLVVAAGPADAERIVAAFPAEGHYVPPLETLRAELAKGSRGQFNIIEFASGLKLDAYPAGNDPLIAYGFAHARTVTLAGTSIQVAPAVYVVAMKLRYHRMSGQDKHLRDIRAMLAMSPEACDRDAIAAWAGRDGTMVAWEACLAHPGEE
jgi:hypothetical protein